MISVSGIRGHVGTDLTPELVARYAAALGSWAGSQSTDQSARPPVRPSVVLGRDARTSGSDVHSCGCSRAHVGGGRGDRPGNRAHSHGAVGGGVSSRGGWLDPYRQPQSNRVECVEVRRARMGSSWMPKPAAQSGLGGAGAHGERFGASSEAAETILMAIERHLYAILDLPMIDLAAIRARRSGSRSTACGAPAPGLCSHCSIGCVARSMGSIWRWMVGSPARRSPYLRTWVS